MSSRLFDRIFAAAAPYAGTDADLAAIVNGPGAIWHERSTGHGLVMDSITGWRLLDAMPRIGAMLNAGALARDRMPLTDGIDIYTSPRKAQS